MSGRAAPTRRRARARRPAPAARPVKATAGQAAGGRKYVPRDERRRQILDAASRLFARHGFAGTTTREVAAAVGTSETVLFRHFPTKQDLYAAILDHQVPVVNVARWLDELRVFADRRDDEALFGAVVSAILESFERDRLYHRLMLFAALEGHEMANIIEATYSQPIVRFLREYVARRQKDGAFRKARPEAVVQMLLGTAAYHAQWKSLGSNPLGLSDRDVAEQAAALLAALRTSV